MVEKKKPGAKVIPFPIAKRPTPGVTQSISGTGNVGVVGDGNHVQITVRNAPPVRRHSAQRVIVQAGDQHVTPAQATEIHGLVGRVVSASGADYGFVWSVLKRKFIFSKYQLLEREKYEPVRSYLRNWIAGKNSNRASTTNAHSALARIHVEAKKVTGLIEKIHDYIKDRFDAKSLADLTLEQRLSVIKEFNL